MNKYRHRNAKIEEDKFDSNGTTQDNERKRIYQVFTGANMNKDLALLISVSLQTINTL